MGDSEKEVQGEALARKKRIVLSSIGERLEDNKPVHPMEGLDLSVIKTTPKMGSENKMQEIAQADKLLFAEPGKEALAAKESMSETEAVEEKDFEQERREETFRDRVLFSNVDLSLESKPILEKKKKKAKTKSATVQEKKEVELDEELVYPSLPRIKSLYNKDKSRSRAKVEALRKKKKKKKLFSWKNVRSLFWRVLAWSFFAALIFYLAFLSMVIALQPQGPWVFRVGKFVPLPVAYGDSNFVDYAAYIQMRSELGSGDPERRSAEMKDLLARRIALSVLAQKYNLEIIDTGAIDNAVLRDEEINKNSLERIRNLAKQVSFGDFVRVGEKLADDSGQIDLNRESMAKYPFFDEIKDLEPGEISDVVVGQGGYYLFRCYDKTSYNSALSYLFVQNKNLDDYLEEKIQEVKVFDAISWVQDL